MLFKRPVLPLEPYALSTPSVFNVTTGGRVLNPTAVFCNDRERYYTMLGIADAGSTEGREAWCVYVLEGVLQELRKVDQLTDFTYLKQAILSPAINYTRERELITSMEHAILEQVLRTDSGIAKASDLAPAISGLKPPQYSYQIKKLVDRGMLRPINPTARQYTLGFSNNYLMRGVVRSLAAEGFIPDQIGQPSP